MVSSDLTPAFRSILADRFITPPTLSRSKSPFGGKSPTRRIKGKGRDKGHDEEFLEEAYRIHTHLVSLSTLLQSIRKPYLSLTAPQPLSHRTRMETADGEGVDGLGKWQGSKYLTDRERDEIDLRGKIILRRSRERVRALENGEKARQKAVHPPTTSALYSLLPSLAPSDQSAIDLIAPLIAAHRSSVIWTLNDLLAKLSGNMGEMQEERARRREERSRTLGGQASREAAMLNAKAGVKAHSTTTNGLPDQLSGAGRLPGVAGAIIPADEPPIESQLTPEQIQQFASENNALLEHVESQLSSVLAAEKSLLEISTLQMELVRHLTQQTEITDRLYDEAVGSVGDVGKANEQLKKARQRGEEGRLFLLVFLLGASVALLFLNWYS